MPTCRRAAAHRVPSTAAWASLRWIAARRVAASPPGVRRAMRRSPICIASSTCPASARASTSSVSASARRSGAVSRPAARRSVPVAVASAPRPSADRPDSVSSAPARPGSSAWTARSAARSPDCAGQLGLSRLQRGERPGGERDPPRRQQLGGHRLPGEHVPEPESAAVHGEQLRLHPAFERAGDDIGVQPGGTRQQPPVELPSEQRGGVQDQPFRLVQARQPGPDTLGERTRHARRGQRLLDQERNPVGQTLDPGDDVLGGAPAGMRAPSRRPRPADSRPSAMRAAARRPCSRAISSDGRRGWLVPAGGHAQDRLRGQVVAQVLQDRERVRVRPVQVLEYQQQTAGPGQPPQQLQHGLAAHRRRVVAGPVTPGCRRSAGRIARNAGRHGARPSSAGNG